MLPPITNHDPGDEYPEDCSKDCESIGACRGDCPHVQPHEPPFNPERAYFSGAYETDDPKHPDYHSTHADIHDFREGE